MITTNQKLYNMHRVAAWVGLSRNELFKRLRFAGLLYESKQLRNIPKPKYVRAGLFTTEFKMYLAGTQPRIHEQTYATESGLQFIQDLLSGKPTTIEIKPKNVAMGNHVLHQLKEQLAG